MDTFLVFYGYLSISFGWIYYLVVFISLFIAFYSYLRTKNIFETAEVYIKSLLTLGVINLSVSGIYALVKTLQWLVGSSKIG